MSLFAKARRNATEAAKQASERLDPVALAFGAQREAIECRAQLVGMCCSGRAGKTRGFLLKWLEVSKRKPGQISVYVGLTLKSAKRIAWRQLKRLNTELELGLRFNEAELTATDKQGGQLVLLGANRDDLIDVLRGFPIVLVGFDEAAFFRGGMLKKAFEDAVFIRLMDFDGECWVMSTPGYVCSGFHHEIVSGLRPGWRVFHWTYFDNPHLPEARPDLSPEQKRQYRIEWAKRAQNDNGWTDATPSYVRDFLGLYAEDLDARVYKFSRARNFIREMPISWRTHRERWTTILGIDYGSTAAFAMVLWAWEKGSKTVYGVRARKWYGKAPSECADLTKSWIDDPELGGVDRIVGDSAAKGYIDEARIRHQLPIQGADKLNKRGHIEHMNDCWLAPEPRLLLLEDECEEYADEMEKLGWNAKHEKGHPQYRQKEDPYADKDLCDAGLYGWCESPAFAEEPEKPQPNEYPAAGTAFVQLYHRPQPHALVGAFGAGRFRR